MKTNENLNVVVRKIMFISTIAGIMTMVACNEENEEPSVTEQASIATTEADISAAFEDIDDMAELTVELSTEPAGGRVSELDDDRFCEGVFSVEGDKESGTITLDFGDGCADKKGNVRKGKIIITYKGRRFEPGSSATTTFADYSINNVAIEGIRTVVNISESLESAPTFSVNLVDGSATWPDGAVATREAEKVHVLVRNANPLNDLLKVAGEANGTTRNGVAYEMVITDSLVFKRGCRAIKRGRIPVEGVKVIETENKTITVDFGDGTCDGEVEVIVDGKSEELTVG